MGFTPRDEPEPHLEPGEVARHVRGTSLPEERARIMQLQDLLIDRFVEHREAAAAGQEERVKIMEAEIDGLLAEKAEIEKWAAVGSAEPPNRGDRLPHYTSNEAE